MHYGASEINYRTKIIRKVLELYYKIVIKVLRNAYRNKKLKHIRCNAYIYFLLIKINNYTHAEKSATSKNNNYRTNSKRC